MNISPLLQCIDHVAITVADLDMTCAFYDRIFGADVLLGWGAAKASARWLGDHRADLLLRLKELGVPDFASYFDFVELSFRAFWQKSSFLEKKRHFVDPAIFAPFLGDR